MDSRLAIDTGVLLLYFIVIIFIGLRMGRKEDNLEDFALGGRRIPWWAVLASLIAAETSAGTFFGTPGEGFSHSQLHLRCSSPSARSSARILVSYIFIKPYYDYKVFSIYEYLTARFGVATKNAASAVFMIHASARLRGAALCRSHRTSPRLRNDQRRSAEPDPNSLDLPRRLRCHRHSDGDLHHARWNQGGDLDRFDSGFDHDWQRLVALGLALLRDPRRLEVKSCNATAASHVSDFIATGLDPARTAGTNGRACSRPSTRSLPA